MPENQCIQFRMMGCYSVWLMMLHMVYSTRLVAKPVKYENMQGISYTETYLCNLWLLQVFQFSTDELSYMAVVYCLHFTTLYNLSM